MSDGETPTTLSGVPEHPERQRIAGEVHARPFEALEGPLRATHLALLSEDGGRDHEAVSALCHRYRQEPPAAEANHHSVDLGPFRLRWERHTEFSTYTFFVTRVATTFEDPFAHTALEGVPDAWLQELPGQLVAAVHFTMEDRDAPEREQHEIAAVFDCENFAGSQVADGAARVFTDFRLHEDGYGRILVQDRGLQPRRTGRLIQRLLEIETYRLLALLAFPVAREAGRQLTELERDLERVTERITRTANLEHEQSLLGEISALSAQLEQVTSHTGFRLSAARAYDALVRRRIENLREQRIRELQTIEEFLVRRFRPAMRTCESVSERQENLAQRLSRAADLLRTRVDIALEGQNRDLLASMNRRTDLQLRLQQTVESLSVLVMSYYGTGLLSYLYYAIEELGVPLNTDLAMGVTVPVVVGCVYVGLRIMRKRVLGQEEAH